MRRHVRRAHRLFLLLLAAFSWIIDSDSVVFNQYQVHMVESRTGEVVESEIIWSQLDPRPARVGHR